MGEYGVIGAQGDDAAEDGADLYESGGAVGRAVRDSRSNARREHLLLLLPLLTSRVLDPRRRSTPFLCKPAEIVFADFEVGETYQLTCKLPPPGSKG